MKKNKGITKNDGHLKISIPVPRIIEEKIEEEFLVPRQKEKAVKVVQAMIHRHQRNFAPMLHHLPYNKNLKKQLLGTDDYSIWGKLVEMEILEEYEYPGGRKYSVSGNQCKRYRLNPKHLRSDVIHHEFEFDRNDFEHDGTEEVESLMNIIKKLKTKNL